MEVTYPKSDVWEVADPDFKPRLLNFKAFALQTAHLK